MIFHGMTCVKNESHRIKQVIESLLPLCDFVFVLDDNSTDNTVEICRQFGERVTVVESKEEKRDDVRAKNRIFQELVRYLPAQRLNGTSPYWIVSIDGDEVLEPDGAKIIREAVEKDNGKHLGLSLRVCYLWDKPDQIRVDGVYGEFYRPSVFRLINPGFTWRPTQFPGNTHCPVIPDDLVGCSVRCEARLKHYGYLHRSDRLKKYRANLLIDANNIGEDFYQHTVQGDLPSFPPDAKLKHAGPLKFEKCDF